MKDNGVVLIGIPGLKDEYTGRVKELLSDWLATNKKFAFGKQLNYTKIISKAIAVFRLFEYTITNVKQGKVNGSKP